VYCFPVGIFQGLTMINSYFQKGNIIHLFVLCINKKKSLKIPKVLSEAINRRRIDNRRVWRYERVSDQIPYIEKEQTTRWPKEKVQKDKQRFTKHTHKTKDQITRTPL
jgi:hypothetical protein